MDTFKRILLSGYGLAGCGIILQGVVGNILQANGSDIPMSVNIIYDIVLVAVSFYLIVRKGV
jgi:hypothetical protein